MCGNFYGIGVGPGDPELITVKATRILAAADVVIAPKTEKKEGSVALDIAKSYLKPDARIVYQVFTMRKGFADYPDGWEENARQIDEFLREGNEVAFLTLGDPMLYSTYIYVYRLLKKRGANIRTIPGVNSFAAIAAKVGVPIVEGDDVLSIIPATAPKEKIDRALDSADSVVLMKVYHNFDEIADILEQKGLADNSIMVSRCGLPDEEIITSVKERKNKPLNYLSTILARRGQKRE